MNFKVYTPLKIRKLGVTSWWIWGQNKLQNITNPGAYFRLSLQESHFTQTAAFIVYVSERNWFFMWHDQGEWVTYVDSI